VLGKAGVLAWLLGCLTLLPCLLLWLFSAVSSPEEGAFLRTLPQLLPIVVHCGALVAVYSATLLGISPICRPPVFAGLIWCTGFFGLPQLASRIATMFGWPAFAMASPTGALKILGTWLYDIDGMRAQVRGNPFVSGVLEAFFPPTNVPVEGCWL